MKKSILPVAGCLNDLLLQLPSLVDGIDRRDSLAVPKVQEWIRNLEKVLAEHQMNEVSTLAGLRARILAPQFGEGRSKDAKRAQLRAAAESLYELQAVVQGILQPMEAKLNEARALIRQMLAIIVQARLVEQNPKKSFEQLVGELWTVMQSNEKLRPGAIKLRSDLTVSDIMVLLAEEIELEEIPIASRPAPKAK